MCKVVMKKLFLVSLILLSSSVFGADTKKCVSDSDLYYYAVEVQVADIMETKAVDKCSQLEKAILDSKCSNVSKYTRRLALDNFMLFCIKK